MKNGFQLVRPFMLSCLLMLNYIMQAQTNPIMINMEARLETVLILNIEPNTHCDFSIKKVNDDLYQITKQPDDVLFSVESTGNWNLSINATNPYFKGFSDSTRRIPVNFVGFYVENRGTNWDNGLFSNIANATKDTIIYLSPEKTMLLENGVRNNIGGAAQNSFILRWQFFYENDALKLRRFHDFDIMDDNYGVGFMITLSESSPFGPGFW